MESHDKLIKTILLADDDDDDRLLFTDVVNELPIKPTLLVAQNGVQLMDLLNKEVKTLPDLLFLDLNMPLKNGFECLLEIKNEPKLKKLPVIIFSTSNQPSTISQVYDTGAQLYIRKPYDYTTLRKVIHLALQLDWTNPIKRTLKDFVW